MSHLVSDQILRALEQGILGLLMALGAACLLIFAFRWSCPPVSAAFSNSNWNDTRLPMQTNPSKE